MYIYIYMYVCIYVCIHIYIYIYWPSAYCRRPFLGVPSEILRERMFDEKPKVMPTDTRGSFMIQGLNKMRHQLLSRLPGHQIAMNKK